MDQTTEHGPENKHRHVHGGGNQGSDREHPQPSNAGQTVSTNVSEDAFAGGSQMHVDRSQRPQSSNTARQSRRQESDVFSLLFKFILLLCVLIHCVSSSQTHLASEEHSPQRHIRINRLDLDAEPKLEMVGTELRASWSKVGDRNVTYFIDLFCSGEKESSEPYQTSECEIEFFGLKHRRKYQCKVWARNSSGDEGNKKWSNSINYYPGVAGQHLSEDQPSSIPSNQTSLKSSQTSTAKGATAEAAAFNFAGSGKKSVDIGDNANVRVKSESGCHKTNVNVTVHLPGGDALYQKLAESQAAARTRPCNPVLDSRLDEYLEDKVSQSVIYALKKNEVDAIAFKLISEEDFRGMGFKPGTVKKLVYLQKGLQIEMAVD